MAIMNPSKLRNFLKKLPYSHFDNSTKTAVEALITKYLNGDIVPVVHGRWIDNVDENGKLCNVWRKCSACGCLNFSKKPPYCPNCGAKMDGGNDAENH